MLTALGSPDPNQRQVDGLGGGISSLSKAAVVAPSEHSDIDVEFNFAQVDVERPLVDWSGTCGNISTAVGPFAIDEGLVTAVEPLTKVRVLSVNTGKRFVAHVPVHAGHARSSGNFTIDGVPGTGARVDLEYLDPAGSLGCGVLPTGETSDVLTLPSGRRITVSIVDVSIPTVFVLATDVEGDPTAAPDTLDADAGLQRLLEEIRCTASIHLGLSKTMEDAHDRHRAVPKISMVATAVTYETISGNQLGSTEMDLLARAVSMENTHRTYPTSVSMATAVAAKIPGTLVADVATVIDSELRSPVRIGHPAGVISVEACVDRDGDNWIVPSVMTHRTARRIMEGQILVPPARLERTVN